MALVRIPAPKGSPSWVIFPACEGETVPTHYARKLRFHDQASLCGAQSSEFPVRHREAFSARRFTNSALRVVSERTREWEDDESAWFSRLSLTSPGFAAGRPFRSLERVNNLGCRRDNRSDRGERPSFESGQANAAVAAN
jgi:hypothetical protein